MKTPRTTLHAILCDTLDLAPLCEGWRCAPTGMKDSVREHIVACTASIQACCVRILEQHPETASVRERLVLAKSKGRKKPCS